VFGGSAKRLVALVGAADRFRRRFGDPLEIREFDRSCWAWWVVEFAYRVLTRVLVIRWC